MTQAGLGLMLLVVVGVISWRERRIIYPLCAIALGIVVATSGGLLGSLGDGLADVPSGVSSFANTIFR